MIDFIRALPKADLHVHIEGTFEPQLMLEIAERNGKMGLLPFKDLQAAKEAYNFQNLQSFLDIYYAGCAVLLHEKDFYDLTWAYLTRAAENSVVYVEIMFDPQSHTDRGVPFAYVVDGISKALGDAEQKLGITGSLIMSFLRHLGPDRAVSTLKEAEPFRAKIKSVGLDSSEMDWPPEMFHESYRLAAEQGYRLTAHAGEEGPPEYIWQALQKLKAERIDHGVHCIEDPELLKHLQQKQIALTVCPLSNLKLQVYKGKLTEKLRDLMSHGLLITINSDDPAYFGGYENDNYAYLANEIGVNKETIYEFCCNGFKAAFMDESQRKTYLEKVKKVFESYS